MHSGPAAPELRAFAPAFAGRFTLIAAGLVALIARAFLRHPGVAPLIVPLCRRLNRSACRIAALMAGLAAGRLPAHRRPGKSGGSAPRPPIPTTRAWLVSTLRHEAAAYASQLSHLLAEPGVSELLATAPTARRLLRPLCRMLGVPDTALPATPPKASAILRNKNPECPDTPPHAVASQATGVFAFENPESAAAPSLPVCAAPPSLAPSALSPPPCPHVRWPWFPRTTAKPA